MYNFFYIIVFIIAVFIIQFFIKKYETFSIFNVLKKGAIPRVNNIPRAVSTGMSSIVNPLDKDYTCKGTVQSGRFTQQPCESSYNTIKSEQGVLEAMNWCKSDWNSGCSYGKKAPEGYTCKGTVGLGKFKGQPCDTSFEKVKEVQGFENAATWCKGEWNTGCTFVPDLPASQKSGEYTKYPRVLSMGITNKATGIVNADANGCLNNISLNTAKSRCNGSSDCIGFFSYDDTQPSRVCFKSSYDKESPHVPITGFPNDEYPNSGFYTRDRYTDLIEKEAIFNDQCLNYDFLKDNEERCCGTATKYIGARRPMCDALPLIERDALSYKQALKIFQNKYHDFIDSVASNKQKLEKKSMEYVDNIPVVGKTIKNLL